MSLQSIEVPKPMNMPNRTLPTEERLSAGSLYAALSIFKEMRGDMPLQWVITFLLVAMEEGQGVGEYAARAGVSKSVMSRHILDLSVKLRTGEEGMGVLVTRTNPVNLRQHEVHLSPKGRTLAHRILTAWKMSGGK